MSKGKSNNHGGTPKPYVLPKDALQRVNLGQAFAEHDPVLTRPGVFVQTPALIAATDLSRAKSFFIGRRGTGKTAITIFLGAKKDNVVSLHPEIFATLANTLSTDEVRDTKQQAFHALVACFQRAMLDEVLSEWVRRNLTDYKAFPDKLRSERNFIEEFDFDSRLLHFVEQGQEAVRKHDDRGWIKLRNRSKEVLHMMATMRESLGPKSDLLLLIDKIDDTWNGSELAVVLLKALMHACVDMASKCNFVHPILFCRENLFQRVRQIDTEFTRLETAVVSLDWTEELLVEMVERRLKVAVNTAPPTGQAWDAFFEQIDGVSSSRYVLNYCQHRPRDILVFCNEAVQEAQSHRRSKVTKADLEVARRKFSLNRLKEVGDEYSENYPQLALVLGRFHGLGNSFTIPALTEFIQKILVEPEIQKHCGEWVNAHSQPFRFATLLYNIGFAGISNKGVVTYRTYEASPDAPSIDGGANVIIHPCYVPALDLREAVVTSLKDTSLQFEGLVLELPEGYELQGYTDKLQAMLKQLANIQHGKPGASEYEDFVGEVLRLCFFLWLNNVQGKSRDINGITIKDWIVANVAHEGFFQMMKTHPNYQATQVIWECKNYTDLGADDFHQAQYYMGGACGNFCIVCFRGDPKESHYYHHIKKIHDQRKGMVLLLGDKDLEVFLRQAIRGRSKDLHIQARFDDTVRLIG
ncbi:hypothetical protein ETAA8_08780 [Anatilimnocola aggregata]|uniref:Uncharacterized protein n=1 Tax=Anatilimnocola aggregata TaxID=2528021 RepID=A0A517Y6G3_9BACT|nr:transposase [Anatilimnocola aggregata]QDU25806.1 hypothetical protein ETAA8_08780 [Anatilimnocola aggregata]